MKLHLSTGASEILRHKSNNKMTRYFPCLKWVSSLTPGSPEPLCEYKYNYFLNYEEKTTGMNRLQVQH